MPVSCNICDKVFSTHSNLNKHYRNKHGQQKQEHPYEEDRYNFKCLECKYSFPKSGDLCDHLRKEHNQEIEEEKLEFRTLEDFHSWKVDIEEKDLCNYIVQSGKKRLGSSSEAQYFVCNRSGISRNSKDIVDRIRNIKKQGLSKLGFNCISKISVKKNNNKYIVHRIKTHYGHSTNIEHLRLSNKHKQKIASKLIEGFSKSRIIQDTRGNIGNETKRIDILNRQDIVNICKSYKIQSTEVVKPKHDEFNIELWVEQCKLLPNNPVLLYKPQGEPLEGFENSDFCLIIMNDLQESLLKEFGENIVAIDSTHGLNSYSFELITIMVVDEFNEGFPVAFMFANKKDTFSNIFFSIIEQKVGTINSNMFMSDITGTFYIDWAEVMGLSHHQLYCPWYVDREWRTNLCKISNKAKKDFVYKTLKYLQKNIDFIDYDAFHNELQDAVNNMLDDSDTKLFGEYFFKNYSNNYEKWAYYFHQDCGININLKLESMHSVVRYLNGKSVKRLDKAVHATLTYLRDKTIHRLIKQSKGTHNSHESIKYHRLALSSSFSIIEQSPGVWEVEHEDNEYVVKNTTSLEKCCNFICQFCDICVHQFSCTCPNYFINAVICEHIHIIVLQNFAGDNKNENNSLLDDLVEEEQAVTSIASEDDTTVECESLVDDTNCQNVNRSDQKNKILNEIAGLQMLVNDCNFDVIGDSIFQQAISNINATKILFQIPSTSKQEMEYYTDTNELEASQNFIPQKRQKKEKVVIKITNKEKNEDISNISTEIDNPHLLTNSFDHSYI